MMLMQYQPLSMMLTEQLRESIIVGELAPGERLTETEIAQKIGVSRIVVRESIIMLISEGLLVKEPNRYTSVIDPQAKDIEEIFELRIAIEQAASKRCVDKQKFVVELKKRSETIKKLCAQKDVCPIEIIKTDMSFHTHIIQSANNSRMLDVWKGLSGPILLLLYRYIENDLKIPLCHDQIVHSFEKGDINRICGVIEEHAEETKIELIRRVQQNIQK